MIYIDDLASRPDPGVAIPNINYVTIDTKDIYISDGTTWTTVGGAPSGTKPKVRFVESASKFASTDDTGSPVRDRDFFIDQSTGKAYVYRSSEYQEIQCMDKYGDIVFDFSSRVFERNQYKKFDADSGLSADDRYDKTKFYQSNTLPYDYRDNKIYTGNTTGLWGTESTLSIILSMLGFEQLNDQNVLSGVETRPDILFSYDAPSSAETEDYFQFQVWYTPIPVSMRVSVDRGDVSDVDRQSTYLANQGQRIIELSNVLNNMEGKINKIGNSDMQLEFPVYDIDDLYDVGDYTSDGYVVTNCEFIFYKDFVYAKYDLTKNYNRLSQLIGVNSEVRQWDMGEQNTLQRKLMYSEYVEIDVNTESEAEHGLNTTKMVKDYGKNAYLSTFDTLTNYAPIRGGMFTTEQKFDYLLAGFSSNGGGNSLVFEMQLPSNVSAGETLESNSSWLTKLGYTQYASSFTAYTDEDGKCDEFQIKLFDELDYSSELTESRITIGNDLPNTKEQYIKNEYIGNDDAGVFTIYKDNREEIGFTYTLKSIPKDYNKLIFGNKLFRRNALVNETSPSQIKIYMYDDEVFDKTTTGKAPSGSISSATAVLTMDYTNNTITVGNTLTSAKSYCLTDENDYILLAVNQGEEVYNVFTFDFKNKRSDINYNY